MMRVGLVACCKEKLDWPAPARDLYQGDLFKKSRQYVERECDCWAILSAKHFVVFPDQVVAPYNECLDTIHLTATGHSRCTHREKLGWWAGHANWKLREFFVIPLMKTPQDRVEDLPIKFIVLAGEHYRTALYSTCPLLFEVPLTGLGIGEQKAALKRMNENSRPAHAG